jgi:anti-sigma B factor antagonist
MAEYTLEHDGTLCRVILGGDLTASIVPALQTALKEGLGGAGELVFDLEKTGMLDSSGIGLMIAAFNTMARAQKRMRVENVSPEIMQLLQSMRLVSRLNVSGRATPQEIHG